MPQTQHQETTQRYYLTVLKVRSLTWITTGWSQGVSSSVLSSGDSRRKTNSKLIHVSTIQFDVAAGLRFLFHCWLSAGDHIWALQSPVFLLQNTCISESTGCQILILLPFLWPSLLIKARKRFSTFKDSWDYIDPFCPDYPG